MTMSKVHESAPERNNYPDAERDLRAELTAAQKRDLIAKVTEAMIEVEGEAMRPVTWVIVEEVKSGDWGIGGKSLTTADVRALAAGKPTG